MTNLLQIAIDENNNVVSIFQVPTGRKCNCTCPECGEKLEAKNKGKTENTILEPNQKQAHFAHASGRVCQYAAESALHKMAKEILLEHKTIMLPALFHYKEKVSNEIALTFDTVQLEQRIDKDGTVIIPDAILIKGTKRLFVEFYRSHLVDDNKKSKIEKLGISAIEVDLNFVEPIINGKPNYEGLRNYIETDASFSEWLFNSEGDRLYKKRSAEDSNKPLYSLEFLKKQEEEFEEEYDRMSRRNDPEEQAKIRKSVEKWKDKAIAQGYELVKIYGYNDEVVYCPKEKRNENKIDAYKCRSCDYFLNNYYPYDEKYSLCGFKAKLIKSDI